MSTSTRRGLALCPPLVLGSVAFAQKVPDVRLDVGDPGGASSSYEPSLASSGSSVYVVWSDDRDNAFPRGDVYFNRSLDNGATWLVSDVRLDAQTPPGAFCSRNATVAASGSSVYAVWQEVRSFQGRVYFNRSTDRGGSWGVEQRIDHGSAPGDGCSLIEPRMAVSGASVYVAWQDQRNGHFDVFFNRSLDGGETWLAEDVRLDVGTAPGAVLSSEVGLAASGEAVWAVWVDRRDGRADVYLNRSLDGGDTWLAQEVRLDVSSAAGLLTSMEPRIAVSGETVHVAWLEDRVSAGFPFFNVHYNRSLDMGATWLPDEVALDPGNTTGSALGIDLAVDGSSAFVAWADDRDGSFDAFVNRSLDDGGTWLAQGVRLDVGSPAGGSHSLEVAVAVAGSSAYAAWSDQRNGGADVYLNRSSDGGTTWLASDVAVNVGSAPGGFTGEPRLATGAGATCHVVWREERASTASDIFHGLALGTQPYGQGRAGSGGFVPTLAAEGSASIGGELEVLVGAGLGGAQAVLITSLDGPAAIATAFGTILVEPPWLLEAVPLAGAPGVPGAGSGLVQVPIPPDPGLIGARASFQAAVLDPGVVPALSLTHGLDLWIL